ncbi:MAG TPA: hypothetical protein VE521_01865 [Nitrososphaera sp.]|jgi:hypothetical protein|nr:hypothetical protein [Nitrososphaera sp.]
MPNLGLTYRQEVIIVKRALSKPEQQQRWDFGMTAFLIDAVIIS